jgi:hypothetical protein
MSWFEQVTDIKLEEVIDVQEEVDPLLETSPVTDAEREVS